MKSLPQDSHELTEHFFRRNFSKMVSVLTSHFGLAQMSLAEDIVQDTLISAMQQWSVKGVPQNPEGWLMQVAKRKAINAIQRKQTYERKVLPAWFTQEDVSDKDIQDSTLKMIFTCCHPDLSPQSQVSLALKTLCGLSVDEIANALLTSKSNINKRLYRVKEKFRSGDIKYQVPEEADLEARLSGVCTTLFLLFNEGYYSAHSEETIRMDLCYEAIRLVKQVRKQFHSNSEVLGLTALMLLNVARFQSRIDDRGGLLILADQDRNLWDRELIGEGVQYLHQSLKWNVPNRYQLMAGIAAEHCLANDFASTNWKSILKQYEILQQLSDSLLVQFNALIAQYYAGREEESLLALTLLSKKPFFHKNPLIFMTLGVFQSDQGNYIESKKCFITAQDLARSEAERLMIKNLKDKFH